jgi:hypothetical protein
MDTHDEVLMDQFDDSFISGIHVDAHPADDEWGWRGHADIA